MTATPFVSVCVGSPMKKELRREIKQRPIRRESWVEERGKKENQSCASLSIKKELKGEKKKGHRFLCRVAGEGTEGEREKNPAGENVRLTREKKKSNYLNVLITCLSSHNNNFISPFIINRHQLTTVKWNCMGSYSRRVSIIDSPIIIVIIILINNFRFHYYYFRNLASI